MIVNILQLLPALMYVGAFFLPSRYPPESALRPWARVGADAYVEIANNLQADLPVVVRAPAVDSATRFLGLTPKCGHARFKLPYADTRVTLTVGGLAHDFDV